MVYSYVRLNNLTNSFRDSKLKNLFLRLLRIFSSFPLGCLTMKSSAIVWETLNSVIKSEELYVDVKDEIVLTLEALKPLEKPSVVKLEGFNF